MTGSDVNAYEGYETGQGSSRGAVRESRCGRLSSKNSPDKERSTSKIRASLLQVGTYLPGYSGARLKSIVGYLYELD
jgi:hypothetical protein